MAVHRPVYSVAFCEHKRASAVWSQQRIKSRHQARRGPQGCKNRAPRMRGQSSSGTVAVRAVTLIRAELISFAVDSEVPCPSAQFSGSQENLSGSGSEINVPLSTAKKNSALLRSRLSPLKDSGFRRLARAAPRRTLRSVHAGSETVSPGGPKPPLLSRTRQHDMRATIPPRASWRLQHARWRGLAGIGIRRRLEARRWTTCGDPSLTNFVNSVSLEKEGSNAKKEATRFGVSGTAVLDREDELGQHHEDHDPV